MSNAYFFPFKILIDLHENKVLIFHNYQHKNYQYFYIVSVL